MARKQAKGRWETGNWNKLVKSSKQARRKQVRTVSTGFEDYIANLVKAHEHGIPGRLPERPAFGVVVKELLGAAQFRYRKS